jgi:hypothetical protein
MDNLNFSHIGVKEIKKQKAKKINGGFWIVVGLALLSETVDVITSNGDNLREAYQNGYEAGS